MNRHLGLFLLTALTTTVAGAQHYNVFLDSFGRVHVTLSWMQLALGGLWFSVPFLGFLTAHEFGHYFAARWHGLRPSLPYYLPAPLPLTGSLGAVIVFRGHFPNRRVLFDFAAGGPLAGFVVAVVALACGLIWSPVEKLPERFVGYWMGEPLLLPVAVARRRRPDPGRLVAEPAPDRARRLARPAVHDDEPGADQPARRRAHRLRGDSAAQPMADAGRPGDARLPHRLVASLQLGRCGWSCSS